MSSHEFGTSRIHTTYRHAVNTLFYFSILHHHVPRWYNTHGILEIANWCWGCLIYPLKERPPFLLRGMVLEMVVTMFFDASLENENTRTMPVSSQFPMDAFPQITTTYSLLCKFHVWIWCGKNESCSFTSRMFPGYKQVRNFKLRKSHQRMNQSCELELFSFSHQIIENIKSS